MPHVVKLAADRRGASVFCGVQCCPERGKRQRLPFVRAEESVGILRPLIHSNYKTHSMLKGGNAARAPDGGYVHGFYLLAALKELRHGPAMGHRVYSDDYFIRMAHEAPQELVALVEGGELGPIDLTYAAEFVGMLDDSCEASRVLLPLLDHASPLVREGALCGLSAHLDDAVAARLKRLASEEAVVNVARFARRLAERWASEATGG